MVRMIISFLLLCILINACGNKQEVSEESPAQTPPSLESKESDTDIRKDRTFDQLVASYERPDRTDWQRPMEVLSFLGNELEEKTVAEIGAGSGYFSFRMVPYVKKVIAIDINERMLQFIDSCTLIYLPDSMQQKIETRKATESDPALQPNEADVVFLSNTYGFINDRVAYFRNLKDKIKAGGRLVIVDYKRRRIPVGPDAEFKIPLYKVEEELSRAGYEEIYANDQLLPYQYIIVAVPN